MPLILFGGTALFLSPFFVTVLMNKAVSPSQVDLFHYAAWAMAPAYLAFFGVRAFHRRK